MGPGDVVERYTVEALVGEGAAASVYRVRHTALGTLHALKVLRSSDPELARRLLAEGRVQATLDHPNLVPATDLLEVDGRPALLMAWVDGPDLGTFLQSASPTLDEIEALFHGIVAGVACAHAARLIHGDLKPGNVLLEAGPVPRVTDFGIVRRADGPASAPLVGTLPYLAPEQLCGEDAGQRGDVWALGVVLYELVCGQRPFDGGAPEALLDAITRGPVPATLVVPDLPEPLVRALAGCLVVDPGERIPDALVLLEVLDGRPWTPGASTSDRELGGFALLEEIGRGAVGTVYRARQLGLDRIVALKVIRRRVPFDLVAEARFLREIQALARVDHPNVVSILAHGTTDRELFFAMDYVEGANLARIGDVLSQWRASGPVTGDHLDDAVRGRTPSGRPAGTDLPLPLRLAGLFADVAFGLHALHEAGVVHRDVKPSNLVLSADGGRILVMDLGLAQLSDAPTVTGATVRVLGTLRYMPPEQLQHHLLDLDGRADVYALGATLTELCTGVPFLDGDTEQRLIHQLLNEDPPSARSRDPSVPTELDRVLQKATAKRAADRYPTARAFGEDLRAVARGEPPSVRPPSLLARLRSWTRRNALASAVVLTAVLSLVSGGALVGAGGAAFAYRARSFDKAYVELVPRHGGYAGNRWMATWFPPIGDHVEVTTRGGRAVRLELRNREGAYRSGRPPILDQVFDGDGRVVQVVHREVDGSAALVESILWDTDGDGHPRARRRWATPQGAPIADPESGAECIEETLDPEGYPVVQRMFAADGVTARPDRSGTYELRLRRDGWGRIVERAWYDAARAPTANGDGYAIERHQWPPGAPWSILEPDVTRFDAHGQPTWDRSGVHRTTHHKPDLGTPRAALQLFEGIRMDVAHYGVDGEPVLGPDGVWRQVFAFTLPGARRKTWFGPDGVPMPGPDGAAARETSSGDLFSLRPSEAVTTRWFGTNGELRVADRGYAEVRKTGEGGSSIRRFYGPDGAPIAAFDWSFAHREEPGTLECLDAEGAPTWCRAGWARRVVETGVYGWWTVERYTGPDGLPALDREDHAAVVFSPRDAAGRVREHRYLGPDGQLIDRPGRAARDLHGYDGAGRLVSRTAVDADGAPAVTPDGWHQELRVRDGWGNEVERHLLGVDGRPVVSTEVGWAVQHWTWDRFGRTVSRASFGADGLPALVDGCAAVVTVRDERGRIVEERCAGVDGRPAPGLDGAPRRLREVDRAGRLVRESWTDADGAPAAGRDGASAVVTERDVLGRVTRTTTFGPDGALRDGPDGSAVKEEDLDRDGRVVERRVTSAGGTVLEVVRFVHDVQHRVIEELHLDGDRNPMARVTYTRDGRGLVVREAHSDPAGAPRVGRSGFAVHEVDFGPTGDVVAERWFDADGAVVARPSEGP